MKSICEKFGFKINANINSLLFLYSGRNLNLELTFQEHATSINKERNQMNILVYDQQDSNELKCPKCGEILKSDKIENIKKLILEQNNMLNVK